MNLLTLPTFVVLARQLILGRRVPPFINLSASISTRTRSKEREGRPSQIRAEKAAHKADVTARNLTRRVPTSAIRLAEPDSHGENEVRDENERAKTMPLRHASTHARTQQRVHALGEPSHLLNYAPATCTEMRFNRCRLSARRSLAFSMLATRYQVMAANNHVRIAAFSKRESTSMNGGEFVD